MKAFGLNALGRGFDLEDLDIAAPMEREDLVKRANSGLCRTARISLIAILTDGLRWCQYPGAGIWSRAKSFLS
jgi:Zn-dependent alcohol dehydrogenase